ncbi:MAG TPA: hypothetical protein VK862_14805 [Afifellaceae bacterium]|nr:hypothetical protein [Afifellaceae bacterium]
MTPDLFSYSPPPRYPDAPGYKERSGTSQAAAEAMAPRAGTLRAMALTELRRAPDGLTADEIADVCGVDRLAMRPRVSELGKMGMAEKTGRTRTNESGKAARVWRAR